METLFCGLIQIPLTRDIYYFIKRRKLKYVTTHDRFATIMSQRMCEPFPMGMGLFPTIGQQGPIVERVRTIESIFGKRLFIQCNTVCDTGVQLNSVPPLLSETSHFKFQLTLICPDPLKRPEWYTILGIV